MCPLNVFLKDLKKFNKLWTVYSRFTDPKPVSRKRHLYRPFSKGSENVKSKQSSYCF